MLFGDLPYVDFQDREHIAAVYYVNNSDGNTIIYDQQGFKILRNWLVSL